TSRKFSGDKYGFRMDTLRVLLLAVLLTVIAGISTTHAQTMLSLQECIDRALERNLDVEHAKQGLKKTRESVDEVASGLYPQVEATGSYQYNLKLPTELVPAEIFGGEPGTYREVSLSSPQNLTGTIQLNQVLFDGQLLMGLKAAKVSTDVSRLQIMQTKEEVVYNVSATYYNIQTLTEQVAVLKENLESNKKLISATKIMLENELISNIDYNRLLVNSENIRAELETAQNNRKKHLTLLRYLMGTDLEEKIRLSPLSETVPSIVPKAETTELGSHTELELLQRQQRLAELEKKSLKASYLPTLSAGINYGYQGNYDSFDPFATKLNPTSLFSVSLRVPIFDGFNRSSKISQKNIEIDQYQNRIRQQKRTIRKEVSDALADYQSNLSTLRSQRANRALAEKIYDDTRLQYQNGLASLTDVLNAETEMQQAQRNYLNALVKVHIAELDLDKAKGELLTND
ncbi:MAG TPA: TolC family protein, partial [Fodinibius sp.]|nr:TolC family protein [Fodinibius sp.]